MQKNKLIKKLSKFLDYVLGRNPDEFGLVPDKDGYVKIKELLKALNEEEGWRFVRKAHINEILITLPDPLIETKDNLIRALNRENLPETAPAEDLPKLLYTCIRRKAQPYVMENGISPMGRGHVILSSDSDLAERMGKRIDASPVLLTVNVEDSIKKGTMILQFGKTLNLAKLIPARCFTGPPLPKEMPEPKKKGLEKEADSRKNPGSFLMDLHDEKPYQKKTKRKGKSSEIEWKKDRRQQRKQKKKW